MSFYEEKYNLIFSHFGGDGRRMIGEPGICRYCAASKEENKGWKEAHSIPNFFGNKEIFSRDECSDCNKMFADSYEDNLSKFTNFYRTLLQIKGKNGIPKTKSSSLKIESENGKMSIKGYNEESLIQDGNNVIVSHKTDSYSRLMAWKGLMKCAYSVLADTYLAEYQSMKFMIANPDSGAPLEPCLLFRSVSPWIDFKHDLVVRIYAKADSFEDINYPDLLFVLMVAGTFYHLPIFSDVQLKQIKDNDLKINFSIPPITDYIDGLNTHTIPPKIDILDMTKYSKVRDDQKVTLTRVDKH